MKNKIILLFFLIVSVCSAQEELSKMINNSFNLAAQQYKRMNDTLPDSLFPRSANPDGTLRTNKSDWWTSGFFPGSLWYLYEFSGDDYFKTIAAARTKSLEKEKYNLFDHDIGFKIFCSFGNELRLTNDSSCVPIILTAAESLTKRYKPSVGSIRSWGPVDDEKEYLVIVDNMMNLELLFWASKQTGDSTYFNIAVSHADKTLKNHYRPDGSCYHVLNYDQNTGEVIQKKTAQGYADESAWSRGQAWGLYGFTMAFRETGFNRYLKHAQKIAGFILNNSNLPNDKIPYWDFNAPDIPNALRDASAAAIIASALIELSGFSNDSLKTFYLSNAGQIIQNLSNSPYRAALGENNNFLLKHGVGHLPAKSEVDVPLSYTDYYYLEAMTRYFKTGK